MFHGDKSRVQLLPAWGKEDRLTPQGSLYPFALFREQHNTPEPFRCHVTTQSKEK